MRIYGWHVFDNLAKRWSYRHYKANERQLKAIEHQSMVAIVNRRARPRQRNFNAVRFSNRMPNIRRWRRDLASRKHFGAVPVAEFWSGRRWGLLKPFERKSKALQKHRFLRITVATCETGLNHCVNSRHVRFSRYP